MLGSSVRENKLRERNQNIWCTSDSKENKIKAQNIQNRMPDDYVNNRDEVSDNKIGHHDMVQPNIYSNIHSISSYKREKNYN